MCTGRLETVRFSSFSGHHQMLLPGEKVPRSDVQGGQGVALRFDLSHDAFDVT